MTAAAPVTDDTSEHPRPDPAAPTPLVKLTVPGSAATGVDVWTGVVAAAGRRV